MKKFLTVLLYIFLVFIAVELGLKIFLMFFEKYSSWEERSNLFKEDSLLGWRGVPNRKVMVKTFESKFFVETDSSGFRNTINSENTNKGKKILMYGDSFLWGYHLNNDELISSMLSKELNVEVKNYGMVGYGTDQEYLLFKETVEDSSVVVFLFYINDLRDILNDNLKTPYKPKPRFIIKDDTLVLVNYPVKKEKYVEIKERSPVNNFNLRYRLSSSIKRMLYFSNIFKFAISYLQYNSIGKRLYEKNLMDIPEFMKPEWDIPNFNDMNTALKIYEKLIQKIKFECERKKCELLIFMIPSEFTYQEDLIEKLKRLEKFYGYKNKYFEIMKNVEDILKKNDIDYIYPYEEFMERNKEKSLTKNFDKHFSKEGAIFVKELLRKKLDYYSSSYR
ncbi:MAG: hypothetical protein WHT27_01590 [candidate division WOR-3 bacterium]